MPPGKREKPDDATTVGLPATPFLYHIDQVAQLLGMREEDLVSQYIWFAGGTIGRKSDRQIKAINIAVDPANEIARWRVSQGELIRWMKLLGFVVYSRGRVV